MNDNIKFEEFITIMAKKMDIPINLSLIQAFGVDTLIQAFGMDNSRLIVNIPRHMQGIRCPHKIFGKEAGQIICDDVKG